MRATETRRLPLPGASQFPWKQILMAVMLVLVIAITMLASNATNLFPGRDTPATQSEQPANIAPAAVTNPVPSVPVVEPPAQITEPEVVAPANPGGWPFIQVEWSEPRLTQYPLNAVYMDTGKGTREEEKRFATALKIMPELKTLSAERGMGFGVAVTSDREHPEVVLLGVNVIDARQAFKAMEQGEKPAKGTTLFWAKLFLSIDRGEVWNEISLLETEEDIPGLAVSEIDGVVHLSVRENTVQEMWRHATVAIQDLP